MEKWLRLKIIRGNKRKKEQRLLRDLEEIRKEISELSKRIAEELKKEGLSV